MKKLMMIAAVFFVMCSFLSPKADAAPVGLFDGTVEDINANMQSSGVEDISLNFSYIADNPEGGTVYGDSVAINGENIDVYVYCNNEKKINSIILKMPEKKALVESSKSLLTFLVNKGMKINDDQVNEVADSSKYAFQVPALNQYIHFVPTKIENDFAIIICASDNGSIED